MSARGVKRGMVALVCVGLISSGAATVAAHDKTTHHTTAANRRAAIRDANALLAGVTPPAGSVPKSSGTGIGVHAHLLTTAFASAVAYRTWKAPGDPTSVLSYVEARLPKGGKQISSGSGGPDPQFQSVMLAWPAVRGELDVRWLEIDVTRAGSGHTTLRAESQSQWVVVRPAGERVPAGVREVDVTSAWARKPPFLFHAVTKRSKVHALVALLNSLGVGQPGVMSCPGEPVTPTVKLSFRGSSTAPPVAVASVSAAADPSWPDSAPGWACYPIGFTVHGHRAAPLVGEVIAPIQRLLGVKLAYHPALPGTARTAAAPRVPVVRCKTLFGIKPSKISVPPSVAVRGAPRSVRGLVAYTNTVSFLIGPARLHCSGAIGADGSNNVTAWPRGQSRPTQHSHGDGLTLDVIPACVGCMAANACPFFPSYASHLGFRCTSGIPTGEIIKRRTTHVVLYEDPPGVAGDGYPSGGPDPANGIDGIQGRYGQQYSATCTLPKRRGTVCSVALNDVRARYG